MASQFLPSVPLYSRLKVLTESIWRNFPEQFHNAQDGDAGDDHATRSASISGFDSIGLSVFVQKQSPTHYHLYVPEGCFDRIFLLMFLFMSGEHVLPLNIIYSVRDRRTPNTVLPGRLSAIFYPRQEVFDEEACGLINDYCGSTLVSSFMRDACLITTLFLVHHELGHLLNHHFEIRQAFRSVDEPRLRFTDETLGSNEREIFEGFEVHADQEAAKVLAHFIVAHVQKDDTDEADIGPFLTNCALGLALLVSLFDWRSRSIDAPGDGFYPHPLVRYVIITGAIREALPAELEGAFQEVASVAASVVTKFINGLTLAEAAKAKYDQPLQPLSQLLMNFSLLEESFVLEQTMRSVERGRRIVFHALQLGIIPKEGLAKQFQADPSVRWNSFLERMAAWRAMRV
jgi:hypothetical protein